MSTKTSIERLDAKSTPEAIAEYNAFVDASPQGILYCKTWWLEATAPGRWEVLLAKSSGMIQVAWPLVYRPSGRRICTPELTQKLGILYAPSDAKPARRLGQEAGLARQLIDELPDNYTIDQAFHEAFRNWLPFYWSGFEQTTRYTYVIQDLTDLACIRAGMTERCRRMLRSAQKAGLVAYESDDLELLLRIVDLTYQRQHKKYPHSIDLITRIDAACRQYAGRRLLVAKDNRGRVHACDYVVYDSRCTVSLIQGADPELRRSGAQRFLDWQSIEFASQVSETFDFEGSMVESIEVYNREFGAHQTPYFVLRRPRRWKTRAAGRPRRMIARALRHLAERVEPNDPVES